MAEKKKLPVPAPEAVPLHRPEVDAAPILPEPQTPPPPPGPVYMGLSPFSTLQKNRDPARRRGRRLRRRPLPLPCGERQFARPPWGAGRRRRAGGLSPGSGYIITG